MNTAHDPSALFEPFNDNACAGCGRCLVECPVMRLSERQARAEIDALRRGRPGRHVLKKCETCMACSVKCPNFANPAMLFIQRFFDYHSDKGYPAHATYFQPHARPNFRTFVIDKLPADEKKLLEKWADRSPCEEFAYPGCNICTTPWLTQAWFMKDLNIRGGLDVCCGEMYFRTGMLDHLRQTARKLTEYLDTLGASRMMVLCTAGYNLFSNVLPRFGLETSTEITPYLPWLWERLESGDIPVKKPLNFSVTIQESCHAKVIGPDYYELPRKILEKLGATVKEMPNNRDCAFCCGIGGGFPAKSSYNPVAISQATIRMVGQAYSTGSDAIMTYCAGCLMSMSSLVALMPVQKPVYHIIELIQMASGEKPLRRNMELGRRMMAGTLINQLPQALNPKRIPPDSI